MGPGCVEIARERYVDLRKALAPGDIFVAHILPAPIFPCYNKYAMEFEWSDEKRRQNLAKHGLDFADVARIDWLTALLLADDRADYGEPRYWAFGRLEGLPLVAF